MVYACTMSHFVARSKYMIVFAALDCSWLNAGFNSSSYSLEAYCTTGNFTLRDKYMLQSERGLLEGPFRDGRRSTIAADRQGLSKD